MLCAACRHENPERAKFCLECGARLAVSCPQCGTELPAGAKFCLECGHRVAAPADAAASPAAGVPAAPGLATRLAAYTPKHLAEKILKSRSALEGERRQVTVLFADLAGFTALAERLDPEEVHRIIERYFELITAEVHRFEGTINQYTGDGVMALFGAPIAHEDAPRRAVHTALGIQRALRDFSKELEATGGPAIRIRIGLNTGPVVVAHRRRSAHGLHRNRHHQPGGADAADVVRAACWRVRRPTRRWRGSLRPDPESVKGHARCAFEILRTGAGARARRRGRAGLPRRRNARAASDGPLRPVKTGRGRSYSSPGAGGQSPGCCIPPTLADRETTWLEGSAISVSRFRSYR
jgi:hypothetical protein